LLFDDCVVSGASLYTPSLLFLLAYRTRDDDDNPIPSVQESTSPRRGVFNRQTGLSPELRLINVVTKEELDADTLTVSRYESLLASDYHFGTLYVPPRPMITQTGRSAFEAFGTGLWDVSYNATRIFSSAASARSGSENAVSSPSLRPLRGPPSIRTVPDINPAAANPGLKLFIVSPYDCVLAVKRDLSDHLGWLLDHEQYKEAWDLVNENPDIVQAPNDDVSMDDATSTPTRQSRQSLFDFFADNASQTTLSVSKSRTRVVENEKRRIGELWIQQLVTAKEWTTAGQVAGQVLGPSPRWEHWVWTFAQAGRFDEITPFVPTVPVHPSLPPVIYERLLGHYIKYDRLRFKELIESWDISLFNIPTITSAIESKLQDGDVREDSVEDGEHGRDWRILTEILAKLYISDHRPKDALRSYIKLQNAEGAMSLISEYHLVESIADDIPGFLTMRVHKDQLGSASVTELEEASVDAVRLLVDEALQGVLPARVVVRQLEDRGTSFRPFLFLYLKSLWQGNGLESHSHRVHQQLESEGRVMVDEFGDLAVSLFADQDRTLLMSLLKASRSYDFEKAMAICEKKHYYPEMVYILSQTGQTKRALGLIINSLGDVEMAIEFAKEQDDAGLWDDLLEFSMNKPSFIRGLLENVGTAIDPIKLVRRIPEGLEIEGLREGVHHMLREYEIQGSISEGVARVLRSEVANSMEALRSGRAKGIKFDINTHYGPLEEPKPIEADKVDPEQSIEMDEMEQREAKPGQCVGCRKEFHEAGLCHLQSHLTAVLTKLEKDILIGFVCGHVYHLSCIIANIDDPAIAGTAKRLQAQVAADADDQGDTRSVGAKVAHAHILRSIVSKGCPSCLLVGD
jgi:vacuolar protein sorting-associated protein 41